MLHFYEELPLVESYWQPKVDKSDVCKLVHPKIIEEAGLVAETHVQDMGIWFSPEKIQTYDLDDVFSLIIENGWEYKSTYWKGGSEGSAHRVLCFTKSVED